MNDEYVYTQYETAMGDDIELISLDKGKTWKFNADSSHFGKYFKREGYKNKKLAAKALEKFLRERGGAVFRMHWK